MLFLFAENLRCLEIKKEFVSKGGSKAMCALAHHGRCRVEVQVPSLFQDQTVCWIRIVSGIDKFVREAMPIQEEEKASGEPAAKARQIVKSS